MALYQDGSKLHHAPQSAFDAVLTPGTIAVNSGIYRCEGCGDEDACNKGNPLPSQNHRQHSALQGLIRWKLLVAAVQQ